MPALNDDLLYQRCADLIQAEVDGGLVGLHIENGQCYGFNSTASRAWELLAEPISLGEICNKLTEEFEVEPDQCSAEIRSWISDLQKDGLVTVRPH